MTSAIDVLRGARELLADPARWTQGVMARGRARRNVQTHRKSACQWCLLGAMHRVAGVRDDVSLVHGTQAARVAVRCVWRVTCPSTAEVGWGISRWNDAPDRQHPEVLAALDRAIALAEQEAQP